MRSIYHSAEFSVNFWKIRENSAEKRPKFCKISSSELTKFLWKPYSNLLRKYEMILRFFFIFHLGNVQNKINSKHKIFVISVCKNSTHNQHTYSIQKCKFVQNMHNISWVANLKPLSARRSGYKWHFFKVLSQSIYIFRNCQKVLDHWLK